MDSVIKTSQYFVNQITHEDFSFRNSDRLILKFSYNEKSSLFFCPSGLKSILQHEAKKKPDKMLHFFADFLKYKFGNDLDGFYLEYSKNECLSLLKIKL